MLTPEQRHAFVQEMERRFVARTPTEDANYANPHYRVGRSEMVTWAREQGLPEFGLLETVKDEALVREIAGFWRRMRRRYPQEGW